MIPRHVIYCDHYPDGVVEAGSNARERKPATVSHEIERKRSEYYEAHMKSEMERLKNWVNWYEVKLNEIREAPVDSRLLKLGRLYRLSEKNKNCGVTITSAGVINPVNYPVYPPELKIPEYYEPLIDCSQLDDLKLEEVRIAMNKVKCPRKLDISVFYKLTGRLPHEDLNYDDERLLFHFYDTFYNESIKLFGKTIRCRTNVLYYLLNKIGKAPYADHFQFPVINELRKKLSSYLTV